MDVRTRFAPSPTGYLHIGGVRTALFNWLLAKRYGGAFILRIDDTDEQREVAEAVGLILSGFRWLGMDWQEGPEVGGAYGPYYQSQCRPLYEAALLAMLESGQAYPDQTPPAEVEAQRKAAEITKKPFIYRGKERHLPPDETVAIFKEHKPAIRFKVPVGETIVVDDVVRGKVETQTDLLGDFTIARPDCKALYSLACTVDDSRMKISHVVRAEEHLPNTPPQLLMYRALGQTPPIFAHIPFVCAPGSRKKLSKRNPPPGVMVTVDQYEKAGYFPEALLNALVRLGWSLDDHTEIMSVQTMIENFSLERVSPAPAAFDPDKLFWMQDHYMKEMPIDVRVEKMVPYLEAAKLVTTPITPAEKAVLRRVVEVCGDRLKMLSDVVRYSETFFLKELGYDDKSRKLLLKEDAANQLEAALQALTEHEEYTEQSLHDRIQDVGAALGVGGKINNTLRAALTRRAVGPGIFDCLVILGKDRSLARLQEAIEQIKAGSLPSDDELHNATSPP